MRERKRRGADKRKIQITTIKRLDDLLNGRVVGWKVGQEGCCCLKELKNMRSNRMRGIHVEVGFGH